ncbi:hypothetical protein P40081_33725 [Paenibacillus sp. FSL P4-0081]|nr:hypothetical protein P40081_33725 [Paenibacillus sp. FSL P4-0081]OMF23367.1 hypothetical protein BK132_27230 [Paenibacillus sp. FSL H8-0259]
METAERKFGTGGAAAFAFIGRFRPQIAVPIRKSANNSDRKSKCFAQSATNQPPVSAPGLFSEYNIYRR